ncbi:MAG TPA: hypothetical protein VGC62_07355 [Pseudomonas sp.]|uniref:hypothetical protein n=1 Tax=Pseudomonas sp. TaxID=306 RepID=UPI002ED9B8F9
MSSPQKQQKRAKRAKAKAKQQRIARSGVAPNPDDAFPSFNDMLGFGDDLDDEDALGLLDAIDPELRESLTDEELEALKALHRGDEIEIDMTEEEMIMSGLFLDPAEAPSDQQRLEHYEELKAIESQGQQAVLTAFLNGPVAAHVFQTFTFEDLDDILVKTLGDYWLSTHGTPKEAAIARVESDDFRADFLEALRLTEDQSIDRMAAEIIKRSESAPD